MLLTVPAGAATIEADVEQAGAVISDETGLAQIGVGTEATIAVYLVLAPGEVASSFQAQFAVDTRGLADITLDLGHVDPTLAPLGDPSAETVNALHQWPAAHPRQ